MRPMARAMLMPRLVLPTPGGPTKQSRTPSRSRRILSRASSYLVVLTLGLAGCAQFADGQILDDAVFDFFEAVVVLFKNFAGVGNVEVVLGGFLPGQRDHEVEIGLDDTVLGGLNRHAAHPVQFAQRLFVCFLGHASGFNALLEFANVGFLLVFFAQLLLDSLHLLAQEEVLLHFFHLALGLGLNLVSKLGDVDFIVQQLRQAEQLLLDAVDLQEFLGVVHFEAHAAGDEVGELAGVFDVGCHDGQFIGHLTVELDQAPEEVLDGAGRAVEFQSLFQGFGQHLDAGTQIGFFLDVILEADALKALDGQTDCAVGGFQYAVDLRGGADLIELIGGGLLDRFIAAGHECNDAVLGQRVFDQFDAALLADGERKPHHGIDDDAAQGQDG